MNISIKTLALVAALCCTSRMFARDLVDPLFEVLPGPNSYVFGIASLTNGQFYVSGRFLKYNSVDRHRIARVNQDGTLDGSFDPGDGPDEEVTDVQPLKSGKVLIGGSFSKVGPILSFGIGRLRNDGSYDTTYALSAQKGEYRATIGYFCKSPDGSNIAAIGNFNNLLGHETKNVIVLDFEGNVDPTFCCTNALGVTRQCQWQGDKLLVASDGAGIVRLNRDGKLDNTFTPVDFYGDKMITSCTVQPDGKILITGGFNNIEGYTRNRIARLNQDGGIDRTFNYKNSDNFIYELVLLPGGKILLFADQTKIIRLNSDGSIDSGFPPVYSEYGKIFERDETEWPYVFFSSDAKWLRRMCLLQTEIGMSPAKLKLTVFGIPDQSYAIESSKNGINWNISTNITMADYQWSGFFEATNKMNFFRARYGR